MQSTSILNPRALTGAIPVIILALVRAGPRPCVSTEPNTAIVDRAFARLPDTYPALVALAHATFHLPLHSVLEITTSTLDVCRCAPVRITEDTYVLLRSVLDYLHVEVVGDGVGERETQRTNQQEGGNGLGVEPGKMNDIREAERGKGEWVDGLGFDVLVADGVEQLKQPLTVIPSNDYVKRLNQGRQTLTDKLATPHICASLSAASAPASACRSPPPPPITSWTNVHFVMYISGPSATHEVAFSVHRNHTVSRVLLAARTHFGVAELVGRVELVLK